MRRTATLLAALVLIADARAQGMYGRFLEAGTRGRRDVIGMEVLTPEGRSLGRISDVLVERETGRVEEIAVGSASYPVSALLSGDRPGEVVVREMPFSSSAGASALLPGPTRALLRASRDYGGGDAVIDLRDGRLRHRQ